MRGNTVLVLSAELQMVRLVRRTRVRGPQRIQFLFAEACRTPWPVGDLALNKT